jgi:hypothetical protein
MMNDKVIRTLERGYVLVQSDTRGVSLGGVAGWISFWLVDKNGERIKSFASVQRADNWWELNKDNMDEQFDANVEREARSLVRRMGIKWDKLSLEEKQEWIDECTD